MANTAFRQTIFALSTGTGTQDIRITGFGATPDAAIIIMSGATTDDTLANDAILSIGFTDGTREFCTFAFSEDAKANPSNTQNAHHSDAMIVNYDSTGTLEAQFGFNSFLADAGSGGGIRLDIDNQASTAYLCTLILIGGSDVSAVRADSTTIVASAVDITAPTFQPDVVFLMSCNHADAPASVQTQQINSFGIGIDDGADTQRSVNWSSKDAGSPIQTDSRIENVNISAQIWDGSDFGQVAIGTYDANGFTLTPTTSMGTDYYFYLAIELTGSPNIDLFDMSWPTSGSVNEETPAFQPTFGLICSQTGPTARNTITDRNALSIAAFDDDGISTINYIARENVDPSVTSSMHSNQLRIIDDSDEGDEVIATYAFDSLGFNFTLSTNPVTNPVLGWAFVIDGATAAGGTDKSKLLLLGVG